MLVTLGVLLIAAVLLFYGLQKYIVYTSDGVKLELPILSSAQSDGSGSQSAGTSASDTSVVIDPTDYSNIDATAGQNLSAVKGILVPYGDINAAAVQKAADRLSKGNALVLQLKTETGKLAWASSVREATAYDLAGAADLKSIVADLKSKKPDVWLVGELCCCVDDLMAARNSPLALKKTDGSPYTDGTGAWLDPYNAEGRNYIVALAKELAGMGFNEILLTQVCHPDTDPAGIAYSAASTTSGASSAVTGYTLAVTRALKGSGAVISAVCTRDAIAGKTGNLNGQSIEVFMKVFDRVYCYTSAAEYKTYMDYCAARVTVGDINTRFVPICSGKLPDTQCWVLQSSAG